jgi:hypothetical protein
MSAETPMVALVRGLGKQLLARVQVALPVLRQIDDEARHLQEVRQAGAPRPQNALDVLVRVPRL